MLKVWLISVPQFPRFVVGTDGNCKAGMLDDMDVWVKKPCFGGETGFS